MIKKQCKVLLNSLSIKLLFKEITDIFGFVGFYTTVLFGQKTKQLHQRF